MFAAGFSLRWAANGNDRFSRRVLRFLKGLYVSEGFEDVINTTNATSKTTQKVF
jgi:hypothetical protein